MILQAKRELSEASRAFELASNEFDLAQERFHAAALVKRAAFDQRQRARSRYENLVNNYPTPIMRERNDDVSVEPKEISEPA